MIGQAGQQEQAHEAVERAQLALLGVHQPQRQLRQRERDEAPRLAPQGSGLRSWCHCLCVQCTQQVLITSDAAARRSGERDAGAGAGLVVAPALHVIRVGQDAPEAGDVALRAAVLILQPARRHLRPQSPNTLVDSEDRMRPKLVMWRSTPQCSYSSQGGGTCARNNLVG